MKKDLHNLMDVEENYDYYFAAMYSYGQNYNGQNEFYLDLAGQYGDGGVVNIDCGTGAPLLHLADNGFDVDVSGISEFRMDRKYSLAIMAGSGFMHLTTISQQRSALLAIREKLLPGGVLTINTLAPDVSMQYIQTHSDTHEFKFRLEHTNVYNQKEIIYNISTYDPSTQIMTGNLNFETLDGNGEVIDTRIRPIQIRLTYKVEMEYLIELCGYRVINVYEDYFKTPASNRKFIWVLQKVD